MDINNLEKVIEKLKKDNKDVWLFANLKMDEFLDKWSIIISAPWITPKNRVEMLSYVIKIMKEELNEKEISSIARLALLPKTEHLVSELLERKSKEPLREIQVNGNMIHEGYILVSNSDLK